MSDITCILIISPEQWDGHFVSKHHYAVTLASQGHRVYFLNPPDNSLSEAQVHTTNYQNLWEVSGPQVAKGLRFYPRKLRQFVERKWLKKLEGLICEKFTTVWLFENSRFYDMAFCGNRTKIYHQVDLNQNFHVAEAASTADICFCTTDFIKRDLLLYTEKVFKIHHGVSLATETLISLSEQQRENFKYRKINVVYVGNLDISFLDIELLISLIKKYPYISFHLVGTYSKTGDLFEACSGLDNIIWWGRVESSLIPTILSNCDVQLLTYKAENQQDKEQLASPHKVMEYLASGKTIVATYTDEYKDKQYLLEMVDDTKNFFDIFKTVVDDLVYFNSADKQIKRKMFAREHTYLHQVEKIDYILDQYDLYL